MFVPVPDERIVVGESKKQEPSSEELHSRMNPTVYKPPVNDDPHAIHQYI
jgi:hypothetical protein